MKKAVTISCIIGSGLIILISFSFFDSLLLFLLAGVIPGTNYALPSSVMLILIASLTLIVLFRFTAIDVFVALTRRRDLSRDSTRKKRMPSRRFGQI